jgi:hypothetical protein
MGRLNRPARPGYDYRSPGQTNANDLVPNLREDVIASQTADMRRIGRAFSTDETPAQTEARRNSPRGNLSTRDAAGRSMIRSGIRAGGADIALGLGMLAGDKLNKRYGISDKMVEAASRNSPREQAVERMLKDEDDISIGRRVDAQIASEKAAKRDEPEPEYRGGPSPSYKKGGKVNSASKRADGIASRGKTRGKMV